MVNGCRFDIAKDYSREKNELNLEYKCLFDQDILDHVIPFLAKHRVATLNLRGNRISAKGAKALAKTSLKALLLGGNEVGDEGAIALFANQSLHTLDLSSNYIGPQGVEDVQSNQNIKELDLSDNNLGNQGAKAFVNSKLKTLKLKKNQIGAEGAFLIALNQYIETLDLSINDIGDAGVYAFAANQHLKVLNLKATFLSNKGAIVLASNRTLKHLNMSWNDIDDLGALILANNLHFEVLNLKENNISPLCIKVLVEATPNPMIKANFKLQFSMSPKVPSLLSLCLFKIENSILNQQINMSKYSLAKSLIEENRSLGIVQKELNELEIKLKNIDVAFNQDYKNIINEHDSDSQILDKITFLMNSNAYCEINSNLEKIRNRMLALLELENKMGNGSYEKWASVFLEECKEKLNSNKERINHMLSSCDQLYNKLNIISETFKNKESVSKQVKSHIQSNEFAKVTGITLENIKSWVLKNKNYLNLIKHWKKMSDLNPKRKNIALFFDFVNGSKNLDQLAKYLSRNYRNYWFQNSQDDLFIKQMHEDLRRTTFFSSPSAAYLDKLDKDFMDYLEENYQYHVPVISIVEKSLKESSVYRF